ncbi:hypothetical protein [Microvirga pakistanensis]|uniref:hypothetical protein n=1 Tax=Microvirga pakistanensis TaxID=1682650 RepID=UPI00106B9CFD|nr:hypothetical protein [Microvirga pakistanensis]
MNGSFFDFRPSAISKALTPNVKPEDQGVRREKGAPLLYALQHIPNQGRIPGKAKTAFRKAVDGLPAGQHEKPTASGDGPMWRCIFAFVS